MANRWVWADRSEAFAGAFVDAMVPPGPRRHAGPVGGGAASSTSGRTKTFGKPVIPTKFPGDDKPDSQTYFPSVNPTPRPRPTFSTESRAVTSSALAWSTSAGEHQPRALTYADSAGALVFQSFPATRARQSARRSGVNAEDPQLDVSDVPFARKIFGTASPWQVRDITYQRIPPRSSSWPTRRRA